MKLPDITKALEDGGVIEKFNALVAEYLTKLENATPPGEEGATPTLGAIKTLFAEAMAAAPGLIKERLAAIPEEAYKLATKGRSRITKDASALS